jgi:hypothetical protein
MFESTLSVASRQKRAGLTACLVVGGVCLIPGTAAAAWSEPLTAKSKLFSVPGQPGTPACPSGGWAELHDSFVSPLPLPCPRSINDYTANHSHGPLHATGFLHSDNGFFAVYDTTGNVFGSSDIAIRLDPTNFFANTSHDEGFVDMWIYRNFRGIIVRSPHNVRRFSGWREGEPAVPCAGLSENARDPAILHEFKTAPHVLDTCAPPALRRTKEPSVATHYAGFFSSTYVTWLERDQAKFNATTLADEEKAWKVYVARVAHVGLTSQEQDPVFLQGGLPLGGALNRDKLKNAHSPKITLVNDMPWVIWAEDTGPGVRTTHVRAWNGSSWADKGDPSGIGTLETKNCYTQVVGPPNTNAGGSLGEVLEGYSVDIGAVGTPPNQRAVAVTATEIFGECMLLVRTFQNDAWELVGAGTLPGTPSGLIGDGQHARTPRLFGTPSNDVFVTWREGDTLRVSTANLSGTVTGDWKDLTGPHPDGHWGIGTFPSILVTPAEVNGTNWHVLALGGRRGTDVSVDRALVGMVTNPTFPQQAIFQSIGGGAKVTTDGKNPPNPMPEPNVWDAPTNVIASVNGQVGDADNYLIWIQRGDNHRARDTGTFVRKGR